MKRYQKQHRGFTLIELLVVIAIIAALAAMATPALLGYLQKAKIVKAKGVCQAIEEAVNNFESEYNYLPAATATPDEATVLRSDGSVGANDIIPVLAGVEATYNPKKIKFFEQGEPKGVAGSYSDGMHVDGADAQLYDPWGEPYYLALDYDYNGDIEHPYDNTEVIRKKALCWSTGPDVNQSDADEKDNPSNFD